MTRVLRTARISNVKVPYRKMVNFKLGEEIRKDGIFNMLRAWEKEKSESLTGIEPMTFRMVVGRSNH